MELASQVTTEGLIEAKLIHKLEELKYTYRPDIRDRAALEANFRQRFQDLNRVTLTDAEFQRLLDDIVSEDVFKASGTLREYGSFEREDGTPLHYSLVNIKDWCKNTFEVVNQLRINNYSSHHRYDVLLLMNGIPVVQIELKAHAVSPRKAMEQIVTYKNDQGNGYGKTLLCFIQLFIVSNSNTTWYFANNNARHFSFNADERFLPIYEFADEDNTKIQRLDAFADAFLAKCTLAETVSRYMVRVASEQKLLMMRPYQVYAVKAIQQCITQNDGNGYIWHTTGSGKTLTSFKASTLLKDNPHIHKCLFVVDRKDLDRQTREEFNRFQEKAVEENANTESLVRRLLSEDFADKVIVTTIQKLGLALNTNRHVERLAPLQSKRMVFIFDECHRSQFGENHKAIKSFFPNSQLFGFTGTPIFEDNAVAKQAEGEHASLRTTSDLFQQCLHEYTITHAIEDRNVLRFHIDYYKPEGTAPVKPGEAIAKRKVVETIFAKHDAATAGRKFNALLATASINDAIEYVRLFRDMQTQRQAADPSFQPLNIACVFSPPGSVSQEVKQMQEDLAQEQQDNLVDPDGKKEALTEIIADYNARYGTNHSIQEFDQYYQDVQLRIKNQQYPNSDVPHTQKIDITIVVDMLLTGFDSKYLNTLYVDKNLKYHGLIQAFSRTNRVLNDTKPYGNILDFRQQEAAVDTAIKLFSGAKAPEAREIWLVDPAPQVIDKLKTAMHKLGNFLESQGLPPTPDAVPNLRGDAARGTFIDLYKDVQRLKTQLDQYTDLSAEQTAEVQTLLPRATQQGFKSAYLETAYRLKQQQGVLPSNGDTPDTPTPADGPAVDVQQLDFEFVLFASAVVDYDYIMALLARSSNQGPAQVKMRREEVIGLIQADSQFLDEREAIAEYIRSLPLDAPLTETGIRTGYEQFKAEKKARELAAVADAHGLTAAALQAFVDGVLARHIFDGQRLSDLLEPLGLGWRQRTQKELDLMRDLAPLLRRQAQGRDIAGLSAYE